MWQRLKILLIFSLLGPPIGGWVACPIVLGCNALGVDGIDIAGALSAMPLCALYGPLFGYVIGFLPAALAGVIVAMIGPDPSRRHLVRVSLLAAALSFVITGFLMFGRSGQANDLSGSLIMTAAATIAGLVAGNLCWRLIARGHTAPLEQGS